MREPDRRPSSGILPAASLVVSAGIAYAIETGAVGWSYWWLVLTGAPFVLTVLATAGALLGVAGIFACAARRLRLDE